MRKHWKWFVGVPMALILVVVVVLWDALVAFANPRVRESLRETEQTEYVGATRDNLKAIHTALKFYIENEDKLPEGNGWMDAILGSLKTNDLKDGEERRKLMVAGKPEGKSGYALNEKLAGMSGADLEKQPPTAILVFESKEADAWNLTGDPQKSAGTPSVNLKGDLKP